MSNPSRLTGPFAAFVALGLLSCGESNPNYCEGASCTDASDPVPECDTAGADPACPPDAPICGDQTCGGTCGSDADCAERPDGNVVCLGIIGDCGACDEVDQQAEEPGGAEDECQSAAASVCDSETHTCRACEAHEECASGVCDAGMCVAEENVVYMDNGSGHIDNSNCTREEPCLTLGGAKSLVTTERRYIFMASSGVPYVTGAGSGAGDFQETDAYIVGYGAELRRMTGGRVMGVIDSSVTVEGLSIAGATGSSAHGINCSGGTLVVRRASITGNARLGIYSNDCELTVERSTIAANTGGGISASGETSFRIVNNFVVDNGAPSATTSGLNVSSDAGEGNALEFNTIVDNQGTNADGITCSAASLVARNNIVVGAVGRPHFSGCGARNTVVVPDNAPSGDGNSAAALVDMAFVSESDFHIQAGSVAEGVADSSNLSLAASVDFDGEPRAPNGKSVDIGADEID